MLKKRDLFSGEIRGSLHISNGTKKKAFCSFLGINIHNFVKNDPNVENDIWGLGPKT